MLTSAARHPRMSQFSQVRPVLRSASASAGVAGHFSRLWFGRPSLSRIFWHDMLLVGSAVGLRATMRGYLAVAADAPGAVSLAVSMAPLPYSLLLVSAVWRSAATAAAEWAWSARTAAAAWLLVVTM